MFLLGGMLLVRVLLREARPSGTILLTLFEDVLCQSTWSELQAADVAALNMRLIKFSGLPGGLQLASAHTHTRCAQARTMMHNCMVAC